MPIRQQPRRTARILALLSLTQVRGNAEKIEQLEINDLLLGAIRSLTTEVENALETAADELNRSNEQVFRSETRTTNVGSAKEMLKDAIALTQKAINRLGNVLELPEFVQLSQQAQVREYAIELITTVNRRQGEINQMLDDVMIDWKLNRLSLIDSNILRIAVAEMAFLQIEPKVAINEAVEIAKTYSDDDGFRFINGVLRKISDQLTK
ncbi:transcription antitermination protein NusB [Cyanobacterium stanieri LEGE 03274]|uniref:Transcription antitermination protein NusB n=1 Tax=Cyanobacterium stanieri LEGE 03274 TaxID=1828756 RepID=A0ABR9UZW2_9CHRO|nr:transcription antitermination factor NusB [Cyanobacterium stanieri]MBE9221165.1 transcription antitermination protein NusB [Cyanobacterium stanieri LEGE 03274]